MKQLLGLILVLGLFSCKKELGSEEPINVPSSTILNGNITTTTTLTSDKTWTLKGYVYVTDGACMTSTGNQSPSILYMALTARAVDYAVNELKLKNK